MKKWRPWKLFVLFILCLFAMNGLITGCEGLMGRKPDASAAETGKSMSAALSEATKIKGFQGLDISFYIHYDWFTGQEWGTKTVSNWIKKEKGVNINWVSSAGVSKQKLSAMLASNELPDVIQMDRGPELESLIKNGLIVPFDDFYKNYPNLVKWAGEKNINALRSKTDGKFYGFPNWYSNLAFPLGNRTWVINKKIYNALGRPKLATFDDLTAYLKLVKEKYPDILPMGLERIDLVYAGFKEGYMQDVAEMGAYIAGTELRNIFEDPDFREFLHYMNSLHRQNLLAVDEFAMTPEQADERLRNGKEAVIPADDALNTFKRRDEAYKQIDPTGGYEAIYPIIKAGLDRNKVKVSNFSSVGWNVNAITRSAKNPERIYSFFDWITGEEGQTVVQYGPRGLFWDQMAIYKGTNVPELNNSRWLTRNPADDWDRHGLGEANFAANGTWQSIAGNYTDSLMPVKEGAFDLARYSEITSSVSTNASEFIGILPDPTTEEGIAYSSIKDLLNKQRMKAILAKSPEEVDSIIEQTIADAKRLGFDKVLAFASSQWRSNLQRMNGQ